MCFVAGTLNDKIGTRIALVVFTTMMMLGHAIFYASTFTASYKLALFGRFIFGIGSECQQVTAFTIFGHWFG